jgi:hypothetical protein
MVLKIEFGLERKKFEVSMTVPKVISAVLRIWIKATGYWWANYHFMKPDYSSGIPESFCKEGK